jgi:Meiotically up-regulated gene 113
VYAFRAGALHCHGWGGALNKQYIVDEIKRTAALNNCKPLGRLRLENEAGIKEHHWGKYWARYNDALREAGFAPNAVTVAYAENELFEKLVILMRRLDRFPTQADITLAASNEVEFPSLKTFVTRFGNKPQMVKRLTELSAGTDGYQDVLAYCEAAITVAADAEPDDAAADASNDGFVYLMKSGRYYKVGRTNHVGRRERELAIQMPEHAKSVHSIRTDDPEGIESYWHRRFAAKRKNGEWFDLTPQDVAAFRRRKFM